MGEGQSELIQGLHYAFGIDPSGMRPGGNAVKSILTSLASAAKNPAIAIAAIGTASALAFAKSVKASQEFEMALREVESISDATRDKVRSLGNELIRLSGSLPLSAVDLTKGYYEVLSAGITDSAEAMTVLKVSAGLATGGLTDTTTTVDALTTALNAYGLKAESASRIADILFETVRLGKVRMGDLAGSIGVAIPFAAELGVSMEELGAAVATMTGAGVDVELTITSLKNLMAELLTPGKQAKEMAEDLGIQFDATALRTKGLRGFLDELRVATEGNREALAVLYPEIRGLLGVLSLTGEQWSKFDDYLTQISTHFGAADKAAAEMNDTLENQGKILGNLLHAKFIGNADDPNSPVGRWKQMVEGLVRLLQDDLADAVADADRALARNDDAVKATALGYERLVQTAEKARSKLAETRARTSETTAGIVGGYDKSPATKAADERDLSAAEKEHAETVDELLKRELAYKMAQAATITDTKQATEARRAAIDAVKLHAFQVMQETGHMADLTAIVGKYTTALGAKTVAEIAAAEAARKAREEQEGPDFSALAARDEVASLRAEYQRLSQESATAAARLADARAAGAQPVAEGAAAPAGPSRDDGSAMEAMKEYGRVVDELLTQELALGMAEASEITDAGRAAEARRAATEAVREHARAIAEETGYTADVNAVTSRYATTLADKAAAAERAKVAVVAAAKDSATAEEENQLRILQAYLAADQGITVSRAQLGRTLASLSDEDRARYAESAQAWVKAEEAKAQATRDAEEAAIQFRIAQEEWYADQGTTSLPVIEALKDYEAFLLAIGPPTAETAQKLLEIEKRIGRIREAAATGTPEAGGPSDVKPGTREVNRVLLFLEAQTGQASDKISALGAAFGALVDQVGAADDALREGLTSTLNAIVAKARGMVGDGEKITASGLLSSAGWGIAATGASMLIGKIFGFGDAAEKAAKRSEQMRAAVDSISEALGRFADANVQYTSAQLSSAEDLLRQYGTQLEIFHSTLDPGQADAAQVALGALRSEMERIFGVDLPDNLDDAGRAFDDFIHGIRDELDDTQAAADSYANTMRYLNDAMEFRGIEGGIATLREWKAAVQRFFGLDVGALLARSAAKYGEAGDTPAEVAANINTLIAQGYTLARLAEIDPALGVFHSLEELQQFLRDWVEREAAAQAETAAGTAPATPGQTTGFSEIATITESTGGRIDAALTTIVDYFDATIRILRGERSPIPVWIMNPAEAAPSGSAPGNSAARTGEALDWAREMSYAMRGQGRGI